MAELNGRWNITVDPEVQAYPSWAEFTGDGGQFVGRVGSARPIASLQTDGDKVVWSLPKQYEQRDTDLRFEGTLSGDRIDGRTTLEDGSEVHFVARRAPELPYRDVEFGHGIELVNNSTDVWEPRSIEMPDHWSLTNDGLHNSEVGTDYVTTLEFTDFKLIAEYRYPAGSNSGIYLRGRYEFQILDDYEGSPNGVGNSGAIYGFLAPTKNAIKPAGEWNTAEITLVGRYITVVLNGETIHDRQEIPGITGGALNSSEGEPGPIFIQGDHGPVTFRKLTLHPAV